MTICGGDMFAWNRGTLSTSYCGWLAGWLVGSEDCGRQRRVFLLPDESSPNSSLKAFVEVLKVGFVLRSLPIRNASMLQPPSKGNLGPFCGVMICGILPPPASVHNFPCFNHLRLSEIEVLGRNLQSIPWQQCGVFGSKMLFWASFSCHGTC
jgi:hypothetical protein